MAKIYFTCSFDDGDINDMRLAELMRKYNIEGTFYIPQNCNLVSQSISNNQIRELSNYFEIGGHTISHPVLTEISHERANTEISNCKRWLEDVTGKQIISFCPPTGRFNKQHISMQRKAGFRSMRTVEMLSYSFQSIKHTHDFVIMPTTTQAYNHTYTSYLKNIVKRLNFGNFPLLGKLYNVNWEIMSKNYVTHLNKIAEDKNENCYFHLWGHSWEIEKYSLWNGLENFFKGLSDTECFTFCNNSELAEIIKDG